MNIGGYRKDKVWVPPADLEEKANPLMNWDDVEIVFALAHKRNPHSSFAASRKNMRGLKFKKFTMRDQPDGS